MNLNKLFVVFSFSIGLIGCTNKQEKQAELIDKEEESSAIQDKPAVTDMITGYILLKDAFVSTDYEGAKSAAITFKQTVVGNIDGGFQKALLVVTDKIINAGNIEEQRIQFEQVSILMYALAGNGQFQGRRLYKQFCPMAFEDKGAYWLSLDENILNPYFGDAMLKCGYVEEVI